MLKNEYQYTHEDGMASDKWCDLVQVLENLYIKSWKAVHLSICLSICHVDNSPGTAGFDLSGAYHKALIIFLLREFMCVYVCSLKWVEDKCVEKTWATFLWKSQIAFGHMFLLSTFETAVTRHPNHLWRRDSSEIKCPSSGNSNIAAVVYWYLLLSVLCSSLKALV